jgi:5-deoxy-5-amino-3-dehydroquinate synthase
VTVPLGDRRYDVVVGRGAIGELASLLPAGAQRVAVVTQDGIPFADAVSAHAGGRAVEVTVIDDGEDAK